MNTICSFCQSTKISNGVPVTTSHDISSMALKYEEESKWNLTKIKYESIRADVCENCGTILRLFVANANRKWIK
jgi:hypothetical protein